MTHQQYRDYSEPSEDDYFDDRNDENIDFKGDFIKTMKQNDILAETFDGKEYFIRCHDNEDFMIYFNDESIEIYDTALNMDRPQEFGYEDAIRYTLENKPRFYSFAESAKARNQEYAIDAQDRRNQAMGG